MRLKSRLRRLLQRYTGYDIHKYQPPDLDYWARRAGYDIHKYRPIYEFITSWRLKDRQHFFAPLLPLNALCFDVGANHGEHTATFLSLGARRVVAVEPQPEVAKFIVEAFSKEIMSGSLIVRTQAVGSERGIAKLFPAQDPGKCMSTLSTLFIEVSRANGCSWDEAAAIEVNVVTLDSLIDEFGVPDYIKIDAEGFDFEVLRGLSQPIALLSIEFTTQAGLIELAEECIRYIDRLGEYEFNYQVEVPGQTSLQLEKWVSAGVMLFMLRHDIARAKLFGDIFARCKDLHLSDQGDGPNPVHTPWPPGFRRAGVT
jgi:FkbM family methyltransferase